MTHPQDNQPDTAADRFLYAHMAQTMDERLLLLKTAPQSVITDGADGSESFSRLNRRYPHAGFHTCEPETLRRQEEQAERRRRQTLWQKLSGGPAAPLSGSLPPAGDTADMLWSNAGLIRYGAPETVFARWAAALKPEGLLFFSHFGPDSLQTLIALWQDHGIEADTAAFTDMHDLGDMLLHAGFYDPVTDMEKPVLSYGSARRLLADLKMTGIWQALHFADEVAAERVLSAPESRSVLQEVTFEIVYGHAVRKADTVKQENVIQFYPRKPEDV